MSTLPQINPAEATGEAGELLTELKKTIGSVPNMAKAMANSPVLLKGWMALSGALSGGVLPAAVRERLALATAEHNRCTYCLSAHTFLGKNVAKLDAQEIELARSAKSADTAPSTNPTSRRRAPRASPTPRSPRSSATSP
jgi:AhpD family alkylhydroperoxidase